MSDISPPDSLLPAHLSKILKENKNQMAKLCDAVLICEGQRFPVHRVVLAASSKYFECLFSYSEEQNKKNGRRRSSTWRAFQGLVSLKC